MFQTLIMKTRFKVIFRLAVLLVTCTLISVVTAQSTPRVIQRDPSKVVDEALTRIFEGHEGIPEGDRRSLKLTAAEHAKANHAGKMFNTGEYEPGYGYAAAPIYDPRFRDQARRYRDRLKAVVKKYKGKDNTSLTDEETNEVKAIIMPFVRYLAISSQLRNGKIIIPPNTKCRFQFKTYCMDSNWPGPRKGEKMQLVPVRTLLPDRLADVYQNLMKRAAQGQVNQFDVQGLVWTLRQIAKDHKGLNPITVSNRQRALLNEALPNGYATLEAIRRPLGRSALPKELENLVRKEVAKAAGELKKDGQFITRSILDDRMAEIVGQQLAHIRSLQVNEPIPTNNSHYTQIAPQVYVRAVYGSMDVQVANGSDSEYVFKPEMLAGQSERKVQRMGIAIAPPAPQKVDKSVQSQSNKDFILETKPVQIKPSGEVTVEVNVFNKGVAAGILQVVDSQGNSIQGETRIVDGHIPIPTNAKEWVWDNPILIWKQGKYMLDQIRSGDYNLLDERNPASSQKASFRISIPKGGAIIISKSSDLAVQYNVVLCMLDITSVVISSNSKVDSLQIIEVAQGISQTTTKKMFEINYGLNGRAWLQLFQTIAKEMPLQAIEAGGNQVASALVKRYLKGTGIGIGLKIYEVYAKIVLVAPNRVLNFQSARRWNTDIIYRYNRN